MQYMKEHAAPYMMGLCLRNLGIIARFQGKFVEADTLLRQAQHFDEDMKLTGRLPAIYEARGDLYWGQGLHEQAIKWYTRALDALDKLASASNESSESCQSSLSPDQQRETRAHAHERVRLLASREAIQYLRDAQQSLDRGCPDRSEMLDKQWYEATAALEQGIIGAINRGSGELITTSDSDLKWISELADFEDITGPRILAQDSLSAGLSATLPDKFTAQRHTEAGLATASDAFQRRRARIDECASAGYRDLATKATVLDSLATPEDRASAQHALALMEQSHGGYTLTLSRLPLPLAFTVKGGRVLAEVPIALLNAIPIPPAETSAQGTTDLDDTVEQDVIWCYRFDDLDLARDLTALFYRLEEIAVKRGGGDTATILRHSLSTKPERAKKRGI